MSSPSTPIDMSSLKPLPFWPSVLYFGLPALLFVGGFYGLMPLFIASGMRPYYAYLTGLGIPLALLLIASLIWLSVEGHPLTWASLRDRFRLRRMSGKIWLWSVGALLVGSVLGYGLVSQLSALLIQQGIMPIPPGIPEFMNPSAMADPASVYDAAVGGLGGNWLPVVSMAVLLVLNILGEEFWWRGVVLPRQELVFGRWTWVVHGLMWAVFHIFKWWDVLNLVPICLSLSLVCTRFKNTTPGIVIHSVTNGVALIPLILGVLGVLS